jgi:plasmid stabilization system protein ParE
VSLPIDFSPEARAEFDDAHDWYEEQRAGLGDTFADRVHDALELIAEFPRMHAVVLGDIRKAVVHRFPYCVFYREEATRVRVLAVFHSSRDPALWQQRIDKAN